MSWQKNYPDKSRFAAWICLDVECKDMSKQWHEYRCTCSTWCSASLVKSTFLSSEEPMMMNAAVENFKSELSDACAGASEPGQRLYWIFHELFIWKFVFICVMCSFGFSRSITDTCSHRKARILAIAEQDFTDPSFFLLLLNLITHLLTASLCDVNLLLEHQTPLPRCLPVWNTLSILCLPHSFPHWCSFLLIPHEKFCVQLCTTVSLILSFCVLFSQKWCFVHVAILASSSWPAYCSCLVHF